MKRREFIAGSQSGRWSSAVANKSDKDSPGIEVLCGC